MKLKTTLLTLTTLGAMIVPASAVISWTGGGGNGDFYNDANWDFSLSGSSTMASPTDDDITISNTSIFDDISAAFSNIPIGNGLSLTLNNAAYNFENNNGFTGVDDDTGTNPSTGTASFLNLLNGSSVNAQFASLGLTVNVDSTSEIIFRGGGDPINSQSEETLVALAVGAKLTLPTQAEFTEQAASIVVNGVQVDGSNVNELFVFVDNGGSVTGTAVPEPGTSALLGIAGLGLLLRRRK